MYIWDSRVRDKRYPRLSKWQNIFHIKWQTNHIWTWIFFAISTIAIIGEIACWLELFGT